MNARWTTDEQLLAVQGELHHFIVTTGDQETGVESAERRVNTVSHPVVAVTDVFITTVDQMTV